jgi:hypothetical protein
VKNENGDLLADSHFILNRWKKYFSQLLSLHNVSDVRQIEVHTNEPLAPGPSHLEVDIATAKLKEYSYHTPAELIQVGGETLLSVIIHKLIVFGISENYLIGGNNRLLYQFTKSVDYCRISLL